MCARGQCNKTPKIVIAPSNCTVFKHTLPGKGIIISGHGQAQPSRLVENPVEGCSPAALYNHFTLVKFRGNTVQYYLFVAHSSVHYMI